MKNSILLIALVIVFVFILFEHIIRAKNDGLDKLGILGLSISILGIMLVIISSFFV